MDYQETTKYLFTSTPVFEHVGASAYKEGLGNTLALDEHFGHPHLRYRTIHVAGTNGKGSCSHTLAAILQAQGYKVGLYTSPHLVDFRERIRVNGKCVSEEYVIDFVEKERVFFEPLHPSFFELTTAMAFKYFAEQKVDIAVVEVGLGGRLDCTNIINPLISVITNISLDHTKFLGNTLRQIAREKAGIIKPAVPLFYGEMPDMYNLVLNTDHRLIKEVLEASEKDTAEQLTPIEAELKGLHAREAVLHQQQDGKKPEEIDQAQKDELSKCHADIEAEEKKKNDVLAAYGKDNKTVHQLIDLALLQNGMLKGEALNNFVKRSLDLIQ